MQKGLSLNPGVDSAAKDRIDRKKIRAAGKLNSPVVYVVYAFSCGHPNFSGCAAVNIQRPIVGPVVEPAAEGP
jgi:hypothetical protein